MTEEMKLYCTEFLDCWRTFRSDSRYKGYQKFRKIVASLKLQEKRSIWFAKLINMLSICMNERQLKIHTEDNKLCGKFYLPEQVLRMICGLWQIILMRDRCLYP